MAGGVVTSTAGPWVAGVAPSLWSDREAAVVRRPLALGPMSTVAVTVPSAVPALIDSECVEVHPRSAPKEESAHVHPDGLGAGLAKVSPLGRSTDNAGSL
jgi:hypothetical protein